MFIINQVSELFGVLHISNFSLFTPNRLVNLLFGHNCGLKMSKIWALLRNPHFYHLKGSKL